MSDEPNPPRKVYQLKPKEFERVNTIIPGAPANPAAPTPDPGPQPIADEKIDVRALARQANEGVTLLRNNAPANRANDVHALLQQKHRHDQAAGLFHVEATVDKVRRARIWSYWILLVLVDAPLAWIAWAVRPAKEMGPASAIVFVCAIAGAAIFTAWWTWHNWFLRTER